MTDPWTQAFYDRLLGVDVVAQASAVLTARVQALHAGLGQYQGGPAVFSSWPVPGQAPDVYIAMAGNSANAANDTKTTRGHVVERYIFVYAKEKGAEGDVENLAQLMRDLFHREQLPVTGQEVYITTAEGPIAAPTGEDMVGRMVIVSLRTKEV